MADNFVANAGAGGSTFAADDIAGVLHPRTKIALGADGVNDGDVSASNPMPVSLASVPTHAVTLASTTITGSVATIGPLTDVQLRAVAVPVSGTVAVTGAFQATQPVSAASLPLPAGAATEVTLAALNAKFSALGQAGMAASQPVVIASDQSALSVTKLDATVSGTITTQNLVPAGTATAGSAVEVSTTGKGTITIQVEGVYTGVLSVQARVGAASAWVTLSGASTLLRDTGVYSATIPSAGLGLWQSDCCGFTAVRVSGLAAMTGTATVNIRATDAVALVALDTSLPAGSATIGGVTIASGTVTTVSTVSTLAAISAGANLIGDVGLQARANATGAATVAKIASTATTNATLVKATAGRLLGYQLTNTTAAVKVMHVHNLTVAPTVGTSVPAYNIVLPANASVAITLAVGIAHTVGISYSITGALSDLDATATAANDVIGTLFYA